jgi:hypothetical protein
MIAALERFYKHETLYSLLARTHARTGISGAEFGREVLLKSSAYFDLNYFDSYRPEFVDLLKTQIPLSELILEHTLFKHYARFLPLERRKEAYEKALSLSTGMRRYLPIPQLKQVGFPIRYCPKCIYRGREINGECYIKCIHQIRELKVCVVCSDIGLLDSSIIDYKLRPTILKTIEATEPKDLPEVIYAKDNINRVVATYVYEIYKQPFNLDNPVPISAFLRSKMAYSRYMSARGERVDLTMLFTDMKAYFTGLDNFTISKKRLGYLLNDESFNPYELAILGLYLGISPEEMANPRMPQKSQTEMFDSEVKELRNNGFNILEIARQMKVHHQIISNVLKGLYEMKGPQGVKHITPRWDFEKIDQECSDRLPNLINNLREREIPITKRNLSVELGLKDSSWRSLPMTKRIYRKLKSRSKISC